MCQKEGCRGYTFPSGWCWAHDPEKAEARAAAKEKAARSRILTKEGRARFVAERPFHPFGIGLPKD